MTSARPAFPDPQLAALRLLLVAQALLLRLPDLRAQANAASGQGPSAADPRSSLKAGFDDAGEAIEGLRLLAHRPPPPSFFDPATAGKLEFANSDLAFQGNYVFIGQLQRLPGLGHVERRRSRSCWRRSSVPAARAISRSTATCCSCRSSRRARGSTAARGRAGQRERRALPRRAHLRHQRPRPTRSRSPRCRRAADRTRTRWSPIRRTRRTSTSTARARRACARASELAGCSGEAPGRGPEHVALQHRRHPGAARRARRTRRSSTAPRIFADSTTGTIAGLWQGGDHGPGTQTTTVDRTSATTSRCIPEVGLAAGACSGNGILLDISRSGAPEAPRPRSRDTNFAYWHSATFNNDGTKVIFTDEWGGGTRPRCRATDPPTWGADAIFDIVDEQADVRRLLQDAGAQTEQENCVAHNGSLDSGARPRHHGAGVVSGRRVGVRLHRLGAPGRDRASSTAVRSTRTKLVHAAATGRPTGTTATSTAPRSRAASTSSSCTPSEYLSQNEIDAATSVQLDDLQPAAAAQARLAGELRGGARLSRSAGARPRPREEPRVERGEDAQEGGNAAGRETGGTLTKLAADLERDAGRSSDPARVRLLAGVISDLAGAAR